MAEGDQGNLRNASSAPPMRPDRCQNRWDAEIYAGSGADELVIFFERDSGAPIKSAARAGLESDGDIDPGKGDSDGRNGSGPWGNVTTDGANFGNFAKEQDKVDNLHQQEAVT